MGRIKTIASEGSRPPARCRRDHLSATTSLSRFFQRLVLDASACSRVSN
jgi:hypothetical protein